MKFTLNVSESANVRFGAIKKSVPVIYAGKISEQKYSIVVTWSYGNQSAAYNLFLSIDQKEVFIPKGKLIIKGVSDRELTFIFQENN